MSEGRLQQELKKRRPFESAEQEACLNIARTADRFAICFNRLFSGVRTDSLAVQRLADLTW